MCRSATFSGRIRDSAEDYLDSVTALTIANGAQDVEEKGPKYDTMTYEMLAWLFVTVYMPLRLWLLRVCRFDHLS